MFKNLFSFKGRIRRTEFGLSYLAYIILSNLVTLSIEFLGDDFIGSIVLLVTMIPMIYFLITQSAKRCHDRGNSGWYQLIPFYIFWLLFADSEEGENEYGLNPKGIGNHNEINDIGLNN